MKKWGLIIAFALLLLGCSNNKTMFAKNYDSNGSFGGVEKNKTNNIYRYKIKIHDRISVLFYEHPELGTRKVGDLQTDKIGILVDSDGYATFPLLGKIKVAGLYEEDLATYLEKKYARYIVNPQININVINKRIIVLGEVKNPGVVQITNETMDLFEAIGWRGGISKIGKQNGVIIVRGNLHNPKISLIDLTDLNSIRKNNLTLYPGNIVYITPNVNLLIGQGLTTAQILDLVLSSAVSLKILTNF